jgi:hypothetical protein
MLSKRSFSTLVAAVVCVALCVSPIFSDDATGAPVPADMTDAVLVSWLREIWLTWQIESKFKGDYVFHRGRVDAPADAEMPNVVIDESIELHLQGHGVVCKDGYVYRISCLFDPKPELVKLDPAVLPDRLEGQVFGIHNRDFEDATNGEFVIHTYPLIESDHTLISAQVVTERSIEQSPLRRPNWMMNGPPVPRMPVPDTHWFPFEPPHDEVDFEVQRLDNDRVRLSLQFESDDILPYPVHVSYEADWWLGPNVPVIERAHQCTEPLDETQDGGYEHEIRFSDFRDCDGLQIPAKVTDLQRGMLVDSEGTPVRGVHVCVWTCDNLTSEGLTEKDFAIPLDPQRAIIHLNDPQSFRDAGYISILELTPMTC